MAYYEANGVHYEIPTDDPEIAKQKIREHIARSPSQNKATQFGRTAAGLADTVVNMASGAYNYPLYNLARVGRSSEEATKIANKYNPIPSGSPVGDYFGVTQTPEYQNEASQRATRAVAPYVQRGLTAGANFINENIPDNKFVGKASPEDVASFAESLSLGLAKPVTRAATAAVRPIANAELAATGAIAKGAEQTAGAVARGAGAVKETAKEFGRGTTAVGRGETAFTPVDPARISQLVESGDIGSVAGTMINRRGTLVNEGQMARAAGETIAEGYARSPFLSTMGDIAPTIAGAAMGVPIPPGMLSAARGASPLIGLAASRKVRANPNMPEAIITDRNVNIDPNIPATTGGLTAADIPAFKDLISVPNNKTIQAQMSRPIGNGGMAVPPTPLNTIMDVFNQKRQQFPNYDEKALIDSTVNQRAKELRDLDPNLSARAAKTQASKEFVMAREQQKKVDAERVKQEREQQRLADEQQRKIEEEQQKLQREQFDQNLVGPVVPEGVQLRDLDLEAKNAKIRALIEERLKNKKNSDDDAAPPAVIVEPTPLPPAPPAPAGATFDSTPATGFAGLAQATTPKSTTPLSGKSSTDLKALKANLKKQGIGKQLFEGEGVDDLLYSAKDVEKFKAQQEAAVKRARKSETVTSFDVQRAQEKYQKSGKEIDRVRAEKLEKEWTDQGGDIRTGSSKAPKGVSSMLIDADPSLQTGSFAERLNSSTLPTVRNELHASLRTSGDSPKSYSYRKGDTIVTEMPSGKTKIESEFGTLEEVFKTPDGKMSREKITMPNGDVVTFEKTPTKTRVFVDTEDASYVYLNGKLNAKSDVNGIPTKITADEAKSEFPEQMYLDYKKQLLKGKK